MQKDSAQGRWRGVLAAVLMGTVILLLSLPAAAGEWEGLKQRLSKDGFDRLDIEALFRRADLRFDPEPMAVKITELMKSLHRQSSGKENAISRMVYRQYLRPGRLRSAHDYMERHRDLLGRINRDYCVPREVVVSIALIETNLGVNTGKRKAFHVLSSMAAAGDLELVRPYLAGGVVHEGNEEQARQRCREKAAWAYNELKYLLRYSQDNGVDPLAIPGSIYGAIGLCQFMPSNVYLYGIDGDGDGNIDLFSTPDALSSIGNYLRRNGWKCGISGQERRQIIMTYNKNQTYANTVLAIADRLRSGKRTRDRQR
ncbi:MAG TPA: lytic murein transglycosylase [Syntrophales bacterium]|jgi:membrane-bound lytic murein transglycosylase B|nr:lytic murein transglycosylase [Syntrophales bacterium]HON22472.1 lytic murein transglycosylase [Syntrophales bacterium]HOU78283.1 lytic murein transglycosylase [Syntrophales bacterium]HPC33184.1 lytic murein transglycosylase [Syntrophales bacterium]HQG34552.1 lytic murein transglycosylase [Syntrophales bacterium]